MFGGGHGVAFAVVVAAQQLGVAGAGDGQGVQADEGQDCGLDGGGHGDGDGVAGDVDAGQGHAAGGGEVGGGGLAGGGRVEAGDVAAAQAGGVDGLGGGAGGLFGLVAGLALRVEAGAAVDDEPEHGEQGQHDDDQEQGDRTLLA